MLDLWNTSLPDEGEYEVIEISLAYLSYAECTDEWGNSEEGREHLRGMILQVNGPRPHEIEKVTAVFNVKENRKTFRLYIKRDPCPVIFFGEGVCPLCGGVHPAFTEHTTDEPND